MNRKKILKILEKVLIAVATLIMITVLMNQYIKTSEGTINIFLRQLQIILIILVGIIALIMSILDKNKGLTLVLSAIYILMAILYYVFKSNNKI